MSRHAYPGQPTAAVGAVAFRDRTVLLVKRNQPPNLGLWAIPGGVVELGETLQEAAEREIREETGIVVRAGEPVYVFDVIERDLDGRVHYHYVITDVRADYVGGELQAGDDAGEARWVRADEMDGLPMSEATVCLLRERFGFGATD